MRQPESILQRRRKIGLLDAGKEQSLVMHLLIEAPVLDLVSRLVDLEDITQDHLEVVLWQPRMLDSGTNHTE